MEQGSPMTAIKAAILEIIDEHMQERYGLTPMEEQVEPDPPPKAAKGKGKGKPAPEPEHTQDELRDQLLELVKAQNKQAAVDALSRYGAKKLGDVKPAQYDDMYAYLAKLLESEGDPADADTDALFGD